MNPLTILLPALLCLTSAEPTTAPSTQPATTQAAPVPIIAVSHQQTYPAVGATETDRLGVGIWSDGTILWSTNEKGFGKPYQKSKVEPAQIEKIISDLAAGEFFTDDKEILKSNTYPPDAGIYVIAVQTEQKTQRLVSWRNPPVGSNVKYKEIFTNAEKMIRAAVPKNGEAAEEIDRRVFRMGSKRR